MTYRILVKAAICEDTRMSNGVQWIQDYKVIKFLNGNKIVFVLNIPNGCKALVYQGFTNF